MTFTRTPLRPLAALAASLALAVPTALTTTSTASAEQTRAAASCSSGYVCIYKGDIFDGSPNHPLVYSFYRYGTYNVANLIGDYTIKNCQTGGAKVQGLTGYNGTGSVAWNLTVNNCSTGLWTSLTSTNSVRVYP
ncbi:hypothetical protein ACIO3O_13610 [Streptomyces sp. NPDC087440]|uniref:hypothetical protein n=1 Tax=Streptomyces sp. NPDC087440 TaxID=3365790 RepID=UPI0038151368